MPRHARIFWGPRAGRSVLNFNWSWGINGTDAVVHVAASEYRAQTPDEGPVFIGLTNEPRFVGDARIWVENIAPHGPPADPNNGVTFVVFVDWDSPLPIATDITVFGPDDGPIYIGYTREAITPSNP
jgi:hypothetical protein